MALAIKGGGEKVKENKKEKRGEREKEKMVPMDISQEKGA